MALFVLIRNVFCEPAVTSVPDDVDTPMKELPSPVTQISASAQLQGGVEVSAVRHEREDSRSLALRSAEPCVQLDQHFADVAGSLPKNVEDVRASPFNDAFPLSENMRRGGVRLLPEQSLDFVADLV